MTAIEISKTHRLYLLLKEQITSGALAVGAQLPAEPALARSHSLSRVTVRRALEGLTRDGFIRRTPGAGTFVNKRNDGKRITGDLTNMLASLTAMGRDTDVRLLAFGYGEPPPAIREAMGLAKGTLTQHALRVRLAKGQPFSHLSTHVPDAIGRTYGEDDLAGTPLLLLLEQGGVVADRADQTLTATLAGPDLAAALGVETGAPLLALTRIVFDANGQAVEHLTAHYRPDLHSFRMDMVRTGEEPDRYWQTTRPLSHPTSHPNRRETVQRRRKP